MDQPILKVRNLHKDFGGVHAVAGLSFSVDRGSVFGLIGPNGSGKSTVFNLITGNVRATSGEIILDGRNLIGLSPDKVVALGVGRTFQTTRALVDLSVLDNVKVGFHCRLKTGVLGALLRHPGAAREEAKLTNDALNLLGSVSTGLVERAHDLARNLPYPMLRQLDIARAIAASPQLLLLDEPTAGLTESEAIGLIAIMRQIRKRGITTILIEHRLNVVMTTCDRLVVLNFGRKIAEGSPDDVSRDQQVIEAYLGRGRGIRRSRQVVG